MERGRKKSSSVDWAESGEKKVKTLARLKKKVTKGKKTVDSKGAAGEYQPPTQQLIDQKEKALHDAMSLNEQLAQAVKSRRDIQKEIKALESKLQTTNSWIVDIRHNDRFLDVNEIGRLYEEIKSCKSFMKIQEGLGGGGDGGDRVSVGSGSSEFSQSEVLCSACSRATPAPRALWCQRCGYYAYACDFCIDAARRCPECQEGNLEGTSLSRTPSGLSSSSGGGGGHSPALPPARGGGPGAGGPSPPPRHSSFRTKAIENEYLVIGEGVGDGGGAEENIYETIDDLKLKLAGFNLEAEEQA